MLMTVGTGDLTRREESLFAPLRKSIDTDPWERVVLLPSSVTHDLAEELRTGVPGLDIDVRPLPEGAEDDADRSYAHFDQVLSELLIRIPPNRIEVDFTRGTKVMSAALVLAAVRWGIPHVRYITGERDGLGMVIAGTEQIRSVRTMTIEGHRRIDLARDLLRRGDFSAAAEILPQADGAAHPDYPPEVLESSCLIRLAAEFYAAWDRLDYSSAAEISVGPPPSVDWQPLWPTDVMQDWVRSLAREPDRKDHDAMAERVRRLVVDLLANGERRIRQGQHEDALVRAYRVLELVGQARLFDHRLDSGALDVNHDAVQQLQAELTRKGARSLSQGPKGLLQAGRLQVARLLRQCKDPLASHLLSFDNESSLRPTHRNNSVLVHGFAARASGEASQLYELFRRLASLALEDSGQDVSARLRMARSLLFADEGARHS